MQKAIIACGCFWEPEERFRKMNGIISTEVGYCGGNNQMFPTKKYAAGKLGMQKLLNFNLMKI